jgi:DNA-binding CsgD family transcriptional regulator
VSEVRARIASLRADGLSITEVARRLGLAHSTVTYHLDRRCEPPTEGVEDEQKRVRTREEVQLLLAAGLSRAEVARRLGLSRSTVTYHAGRLDLDIDEGPARRYDWAEIQRYYDLGHSVRECERRFGFSSYSWSAAVKRGAVVPRPVAMPIEELLAPGKPRSRGHLKMRLIGAGLKRNQCEQCGLTEWRGRPLSMALHHRNGHRHDNRLDNLELLCPNCHSQTKTFSGRNGHRRSQR